ncbi:hypothetical protein DSO57_1032956 [Entomophthora muscae]|uniref:Uncharacterized protein n=1 Tax=Entomophthora muscae TaxID=34485 RepID=A0ACC2SP92_9FUNG|nr:hypothetical protein DSO57_1032956 [Entomophthora muscae]
MVYKSQYPTINDTLFLLFCPFLLDCCLPQFIILDPHWSSCNSGSRSRFLTYPKTKFPQKNLGKEKIQHQAAIHQLPTPVTPSLDQWRAKAWEIKHKQIEGGTKHLEARYAIGDPVYTLNPNSAKLEPNHLGPFKIAAVYDNHTYQLEDAQGNTKKLHHDCLRPCHAIPTQKLFVRTFPDLPQTPVLVSDNKQGARGCCNRVSRLAC